jgi:hypothetical protein
LQKVVVLEKQMQKEINRWQRKWVTEQKT